MYEDRFTGQKIISFLLPHHSHVQNIPVAINTTN